MYDHISRYGASALHVLYSHCTYHQLLDMTGASIICSQKICYDVIFNNNNSYMADVS